MGEAVSDEPKVWEREGCWYYENSKGMAVCCNSREVADYLESEDRTVQRAKDDLKKLVSDYLDGLNLGQ